MMAGKSRCFYLQISLRMRWVMIYEYMYFTKILIIPHNPAIINVDIYNKFTKMQFLVCAVIVDVFTWNIFFSQSWFGFQTWNMAYNLSWVCEQSDSASEMRIHAAIQLMTLLGLMGSSIGVFTPILSSFLAKMMNAARLVRYFQAQGCRSFLFRGYPGKVHVHVIMEVKEDKVEKFLKLIPGFLVATQVSC